MQEILLASITLAGVVRSAWLVVRPPPVPHGGPLSLAAPRSAPVSRWRVSACRSGPSTRRFAVA